MKLRRVNGILFGEMYNGVDLMVVGEYVVLKQEDQVIIVPASEMCEVVQRIPQVAAARKSIDDATPEEWDQVCMNWYGNQH